MVNVVNDAKESTTFLPGLNDSGGGKVSLGRFSTPAHSEDSRLRKPRERTSCDRSGTSSPTATSVGRELSFDWWERFPGWTFEDAR